jgi:8-hydroxy-5-deazaflavin:NADPH oxidoreductase
MRIAIIGAGAMGSALARRLVAAGHAVVIGSRDTGRARAAAARVGAASGTGYAEAADAADVVVLTVPWRAVAAVVPELPLEGKILVDATNPYLDDTFDGGDASWSAREEFPPGESGASAIQTLAPGARVVKAWNHVWARAAERGLGEVRPAVFVCGDDPDARAVVAGLAGEMGFDPHDAGGLEQAGWLEALTPLVIALGDSSYAITMTRTPAEI